MSCGIDTLIAERRLNTTNMISAMQQYPQGSSFIGSGLGNYIPGQAMMPEPQPKRRKTMLENVKGYIEKHKDMIFTLGLVILVDHFLFKGALRERIKSTVEGALKKVENSFHKEA